MYETVIWKWDETESLSSLAYLAKIDCKWKKNHLETEVSQGTGMVFMRFSFDTKGAHRRVPSVMHAFFVSL